jgi:hypothetical protein
MTKYTVRSKTGIVSQRSVFILIVYASLMGIEKAGAASIYDQERAQIEASNFIF